MSWLLPGWRGSSAPAPPASDIMPTSLPAPSTADALAELADVDLKKRDRASIPAAIEGSETMVLEAEEGEPPNKRLRTTTGGNSGGVVSTALSIAKGGATLAVGTTILGTAVALHAWQLWRQGGTEKGDDIDAHLARTAAASVKSEAAAQKQVADAPPPPYTEAEAESSIPSPSPSPQPPPSESSGSSQIPRSVRHVHSPRPRPRSRRNTSIPPPFGQPAVTSEQEEQENSHSALEPQPAILAPMAPVPLDSSAPSSSSALHPLSTPSRSIPLPLDLSLDEDDDPDASEEDEEMKAITARLQSLISAGTEALASKPPAWGDLPALSSDEEEMLKAPRTAPLPSVETFAPLPASPRPEREATRSAIPLPVASTSSMATPRRSLGSIPIPSAPSTPTGSRHNRRHSEFSSSAFTSFLPVPSSAGGGSKLPRSTGTPGRHGRGRSLGGAGGEPRPGEGDGLVPLERYRASE